VEKRVRAVIGAILWTAVIAWPAAQTGIPKSTQLNPGHFTLDAGNFIVIGCVSREGPSTQPTFVPSRSAIQHRSRVGSRCSTNVPTMPATSPSNSSFQPYSSA